MPVPLFYPIAMEIAGPTAMWTRPDTGDCPVSYPAPTYSAVKAIFESVLWGPDIEIIPLRAELCKPVYYHNYTFGYGGPLRSAAAINKGNQYLCFATVLIDVCYKLYAEVTMNPKRSALPERAMQWDSRTTSPGHAYQAIFGRRLRHGQSYAVPCLGWREFTPSYFGELREETTVCETMPDIYIPSMLRQVFSHGYQSPVDYVFDQNLTIHRGVITYPKRGGYND